MTAALWMALRSVRHAWGRSLLIAACLAIGLALPAGSRVIASRLSEALLARAEAVPLVIGAKGSRFDLVFSTLYYRGGADLDPVAYHVYKELLGERDTVALPVALGATADAAPIVATSPELFEQLGLRIASGRKPAALGEAVVGGAAARSLGLGPGSEITTDAELAYDITAVPPATLRIVGVLAPTNGPDDHAVFVDIETQWIIAGFAHGHTDAKEVEDERLLLGKTDGHVIMSNAAPTVLRVTPENINSFHLHGSRDELPLTGVLVFPETDKALALVSSRFNASGELQAVRPIEVAVEVLEFLARARAAADIAGALLLLVTLSLGALITALVARLRAAEMRALADIGAPSGLVTMTLVCELTLLVVAGSVIALALTGLAAIGADAIVGLL